MHRRSHQSKSTCQSCSLFHTYLPAPFSCAQTHKVHVSSSTASSCLLPNSRLHSCACFPIVYFDPARIRSTQGLLTSRPAVLFNLKILLNFFLKSSPKNVFYWFEREREREKHCCERETSIGCLSYAPQPGMEPATQVCGLTENRTHSLLVCRPMLQPTEPRSQGKTPLYF